MSQLSRTSSSYSIYTSGKEVIHFDSDSDEERSLPDTAGYPISSQLSRFSQATTDGSSNAATDIINLESDSDDDDLAKIRANALSQSNERLLSSPPEASLGEQSLLTKSSSAEILYLLTGESPTSGRFLSPPTDEDYDSPYEPFLSNKKRKSARVSGNPRKRRKTADEIAEENVVKAEEREANRLRKQIEKDMKLAQKLEAKERKAQEKAEQETDKAAKRSHLEANKLVTDKKSTLAEMVIEASSPLLTHSVFGLCLREFQSKLQENRSGVTSFESRYPFPLVMRWRRRVDKEFNTELREWKRVDIPYEALEPLFALFYTAEDLFRRLRSNEDHVIQEIGLVKELLVQEPERRIQTLSTCGWQIVLIIFGVEAFCKGKSSSIREAFESFSIRTNVYHKAHVITCENPQDFAQKLFDISADQGFKEYKLVKRSHLPYVSDISIKSGADLAETYKNMLAQNYKFTRPVVDAVFNAKPSLMQLMSAYAEVEDKGQRELLFERVMVHRYREAGQSSKSMNASLSRRLHATTFGNDPSAFVGPESAANVHRQV